MTLTLRLYACCFYYLNIKYNQLLELQNPILEDGQGLLLNNQSITVAIVRLSDLPLTVGSSPTQPNNATILILPTKSAKYANYHAIHYHLIYLLCEWCLG